MSRLRNAVLSARGPLSIAMIALMVAYFGHQISKTVANTRWADDAPGIERRLNDLYVEPISYTRDHGNVGGKLSSARPRSEHLVVDGVAWDSCTVSEDAVISCTGARPGPLTRER